MTKFKLFALLLTTFSGVSIAQLQFQRTWGTDGAEEFHSIASVGDSNFICAGEIDYYTDFDVMLTRVDQWGDTLWTKMYDHNDGELGNKVVPTSDGGFLIIGTAEAPLSGPGLEDILVIKTEQNGDTLWSKVYGGTGEDFGFSGLETSDGNYLVVGQVRDDFGAGNPAIYAIKLDTDGDTLWTQIYDQSEGGESGFDVMQLADNGFIIAGTSDAFGSNQVSLALVRTDEMGDTLWTRVYESNEIYIAPYVGCMSIDTTLTGDFIIGTFDDDAWGDPVLMKVKSNGDLLWSRIYKSFDYEEIHKVKALSDGSFLLAGSSYSASLGMNDVLILNINSTGNIVSSTVTGGALDERLTDFVLGSDSGVMAIGARWLPGLNSQFYFCKTDSSWMNPCPTVSLGFAEDSFAYNVWSGMDVFSGTNINNAPLNILLFEGVDSTFCLNCDSAVANFSITDSAFTVVFTDESGNFPETWFWDFGDGATSTQQNPTHDYGTSGTYTACLTVTNICSSDMICFPVTVDDSGIKTNFEPHVLVYPNPATDKCIIDLSGNTAEVAVLNTHGQVVANYHALNGKSELDLAHLASGLYFIKVTFASQQSVVKKLHLNR